MLYGIEIFATDYGIRPDEVARLVEERGFESLWFPEHTHIPASRLTPYPAGGELPRRYAHALDPFVALTAAAAATTRLKLATGVCLVIERDPIVTAKAVASLDQLSRGRFLFGIGGGWNREEMADHGTEFRTRWRLLRERVLAMKQIWTQDEATFHGRFVDFDRIWSYPKPVQTPHPPIIMGGDGPTTFERVVEYCDGWMPLRGRRPEGGTIAEKVAELRRRAEQAGRDPASISVTLFQALPDRAELAQLQEAGVERAVFVAPDAGRELVEPELDRLARLLR
jgi:probable F420-dependent oxidoreductase